MFYNTIFKVKHTMWLVYALGSAFFAGITSILAKCGIKKTDSHIATAVRTVIANEKNPRQNPYIQAFGADFYRVITEFKYKYKKCRGKHAPTFYGSLFLFIKQHAMAIPLIFGVGDLVAEFFAFAFDFIVLTYFAGAITALLLQSLKDGFDDFFIFI